MTSIAYIGMDVHTTNYTICAFQIEGEKVFGETTLNPDVKELVKYLTRLQERLGKNTKFICGYEAGCLGYTLYHDLKGLGYECVILAPTTMAASPNEKIKTDKRDAVKIAKCLAYGNYSPVYVPTDEDNAVKEYIRMRDDAKAMLKQTKQQIIAFCIRHGKHFDGKSYWTQKHIAWLGTLQMKDEILQETLTEYMLTYHQLSDKVDRFDKRIEELAQKESYAENVKKLVCFKGIKTHTALSLLVEIGDFKRFPSAQQFAAFLGLVPIENSSGKSQHRFGITKAGNSHLRRLLKSWERRQKIYGTENTSGRKPTGGDSIRRQGKRKASQEVYSHCNPIKSQYCQNCSCKRISLFCLGNDDGKLVLNLRRP